MNTQFESYYLVPPMDETDPRYIKSFDLEQENEIREFFKKYGFVAVRGMLTEEELKTSKDEIFTNLTEQMRISDKF